MSSPVSEQELRAAIAELPPVSAVIQRILAVLQDPRSDVDDVARLVRTETALAAQVLRLANSALYGLPERVTSIHEAVQHLGILEVQRLVTALGSRQLFLRPLLAYGILADALWEHALGVAVGAETCARYAGSDRGLAYLTGILHSVGFVALDRVAAARHLHPRDRDAPLDGWEREHFGTDNATIAARVLRIWEFPESVTEVVAARYQPHTSGAPEAAVLHLGSVLADRLGVGLVAEKGLFRAPTELIAAAGVPLEDFSEAELDARQALDRARALLRLA
ncbi:MAG: HDOD domain-containing protein [Opitutaceae bacterium]|nr:HDOD domain-containing protein [Opitutaceae bacterium]